MAENKPSTSPILASIANTMSFPQAMQAIRDGKSITKLEWDNPQDICQLRQEWLSIRRSGKWHRWVINDGDVTGDDWIVIEPAIDKSHMN